VELGPGRLPKEIGKKNGKERKGLKTRDGKEHENYSTTRRGTWGGWIGVNMNKKNSHLPLII